MKSPYEPLNWLVAGEPATESPPWVICLVRACSLSWLTCVWLCWISFSYSRRPQLGHGCVGQEPVHGHSPQVDVLLPQPSHYWSASAPNGWRRSNLWSWICKLGLCSCLGTWRSSCGCTFGSAHKRTWCGKIMRNTVALGASLAICHLDFSLGKCASKHLCAQRQEVVDFNVKMARAGYDYAKENFKTPQQRINCASNSC